MKTLYQLIALVVALALSAWLRAVVDWVPIVMGVLTSGFKILLFCVAIGAWWFAILYLRWSNPKGSPFSWWAAVPASAAVPIVLLWMWLGVPPFVNFSLELLIFVVVFFGAAAGCFWFAVRAVRSNSNAGQSVVNRFGRGGIVTALHLILFLVPPTWTIARTQGALENPKFEPLEPKSCDLAGEFPSVAHLSDLHVTADGGPTKDKSPSGNKLLKRTLDQIQALGIRLLVISGDLTDRGLAEEWGYLNSVMKGYPMLRSFVSPGNHDLNHFFDGERRMYMLPRSSLGKWDERTYSRLGTVADFQSQALEGVMLSDDQSIDSWVAAINSKRPTPEEMAEASKRYQQCLDMAEVQRVPLSGCRLAFDRRIYREEKMRSLKSHFPWYAVDSARHMALLSLRSVVVETPTVGQNAIGYIDDAQIDRVKDILRELPQSVDLILLTMHHPLFQLDAVKPPCLSCAFDAPAQWMHDAYESKWFMSIFLSSDAVQAQKLFGAVESELARRPKAQAFFMVGHRHMRTATRSGAVTLLEAPSLGSPKGTPAGFYVIARPRNGSNYEAHWCNVVQPPTAVDAGGHVSEVPGGNVISQQ